MSDTKIASVVAKEGNGNIQITFTIPFSFVTEAQAEVVEEYSKEAEIPGFRKGKAPIEKVKEKIPTNTLVEKALAKILPEALSQAISQNNLKPAVYPKFELVKAKDNEPWEVRAVTCELPKIDLGDYQKIAKEAIKISSIWTPEKGKPEEKPKEPSKEEKEEKVIKALLDNIKVDVPKLLISEEVDARLSSLLQRIERLGLQLEGYLSSVGKTPEKLREEYEVQAKNTIAIELILNEIIKDRKIEIKESQVDEAIKAASADPKLAESLKSEEQKRFIKSVLARRTALDYLTSLI